MQLTKRGNYLPLLHVNRYNKTVILMASYFNDPLAHVKDRCVMKASYCCQHCQLKCGKEQVSQVVEKLNFQLVGNDNYHKANKQVVPIFESCRI